MKIKHRLIGSIAVIFLIIVGMFAATWVVTSSQKDDSLVINLAGRQRMLTQKLSKETLAYGSINNAAIKTQINSTIAVFETTLSALMNSGDAPLTLDPNGPKASLPKPSPEVRAQLVKVDQLWSSYKQVVQRSAETRKPQVAKLYNESVAVLKAMNKGVVMMQAESEGRATTLLVTQIVCIGLGVVILILVLISLGKLSNQT